MTNRIPVVDGTTPINKAWVDNLLDVIFPIGSTYTTQEDTNPNTILGFGTWERLKGKVLVGLDENDANFNVIGKTGGEKTHTLTVNEMATHSHIANNFLVNVNTGNIVNVGAGSGFVTYFNDNSVSTNEAGNSQPFNILQPYEVVGYMWIRRS